MKRTGPPAKYVAVGDQVLPAGPTLREAMEAIPMTGSGEAYRQRLVDFQKANPTAREQQFARPFLVGAIADAVLAYKPKPKSKPARKRARRAKKIAQAADV